MKLSFHSKPKADSFLIYPVFKGEKAKDVTLAKLIKELSVSKEFEGDEGQAFFLYRPARNLPRKVLLLGLGKAKNLKTASVMAAMGTGIKSAMHHGGKKAAAAIPDALMPFSQAIAEALALASHQPSAVYKTGKTREKLNRAKIEEVEIVGLGRNKDAQKMFERGFAISSIVNDVRDWVNAPPNYSSAAFFDEKAKEIAKETGAKLTIMRKKELEKLGMGAILGVNRGSPDEARLTILEYTPKGTEKDAPLAFVGKGILFDSGGYNLKPRGYIEDMQLDKAGAAVVLGLVRAMHRLGIKRRIVAVAPFTENLIGEKALKPSEILTTYSGKTIEITNTDGEGRLVLADSVAYTIGTFKPSHLIDVATLTGACMVALGERHAGLFGNNEDLAKKLREAGDEVDELLWPLPLHKDDCEKMKGHYADLRNADLGSERNAGASKGAAFIQEFIGKTKWAHLDIAGPAFVSDPKKYEHKGATGFGVRVLLRFLEKWTNEK